MKTAPMILVLAVAVMAVWMWRRKRSLANPVPAPVGAPPRRRERYTQVSTPRNYRLSAVPQPGDDGPLAAWLARVVDPAVPAPTAGEAVPHDDEEMKRVMTGVLRRVNDISGLGLSVVSVDAVSKTVDQFKTLRYEADVMVYSKSKALASKVMAAVDVMASGKVYVRNLRVHAAAKDAGGVAASNGIGFEEKHAAFEPAVPY